MSKSVYVLKLSVITAILLAFLGCQNKPPEIQALRGPDAGQVNTVQTFYVITSDPEGDSISCQFDWGDGKSSLWSEFEPSGAIFSDTHTFNTEGEVNITARAKDSKGKISNWSKPKSFSATSNEWVIRLRYAEVIDEDSVSFISTPAIADDGKVYVGCSFGDFHMISFTNYIKYQHPDEALFISSPAIGADGTVYVGCEDGYLYAFTPNLGRKWQFPTSGEIISSPALGSDGTVYVLSDDGFLYAISDQGQKIWESLIPDAAFSSPAIDKDGTIYLGSEDGFLYAIDPNNGSEKWRYDAGSAINSSPAISADGRICFGTEDGYVLCVDTDGSKLWDYPMGGIIISSPVFDTDGNSYIGSENGDLYCLDSLGNERWSFRTDGEATSSPAVRQDGLIYYRVLFADQDSLFAINQDGTRRWSVSLGISEGDEPIPSPTIAQDGSVYISGGDALYGFVGKTGGAASSSWPMFRHDAKHTGRLTSSRSSSVEARIVSRKTDDRRLNGHRKTRGSGR
ncbi:MAG: PQQ-binding-like beta-propeller repeat protein [candidate division WOR-3 bacterium]|nr:PQQ-binding-like beta-propeller repeat protein [candidate division WOR-3 bacterium]